MIVYYILCILASIISLWAFSKHISFSYASAAPVVVMIVLAFWAFFYNEQKTKKTMGDTAYTVGGERFSNEEQKALYACLSKSACILIPIIIPFVFFFPDVVKVLSIAFVFVSILCGRIVFDIRFSKSVKERIAREKSELVDQLKKEENGKI